MYPLNELHEKITQQIIEKRNQQIAETHAAKKAAAARAQQAQPQMAKIMKAAGLDTAKLDALDRELALEAEKTFQATDAQMKKNSEALIPSRDLEIEKTFTPDNGFVLTPAWSAVFSDHLEEDKLVTASFSPSRAVLTNATCYDAWNWARGGGWGCTGGVGENQQWIDFGFWFLPPRSGFYNIQPRFRFRGYYIVQADDSWYNCKYARTVISAWTNVYQYNWKGWNHIDVLNVGNDNINVNNRFDDDRITYNAALLGGGDWTWIQATIGLYVYAKGDGSYAKNDFATGDANYLCVPYCYVY